MDWRSHSELLLEEGQFQRYYRMSSASFEHLLLIFGPMLQVDEGKSWNHTGITAVSATNRLQMGISWLSGYS